MLAKRVFLTGISGFLGGLIAERLLEAGHDVAGYLRHTNRLGQPVMDLMGKVEMHYGDLRDFSAITVALKSYRPDVVIHLGAITPVAYSFAHPQEAFEVNAGGTINMVEACRRFLPNLEGFILAGSLEVYGAQPEENWRPFTEDFPVYPAAPYAVAKLAAEKYVQYAHYAYGFPGVVVRNTNCYGRAYNHYFIVERTITQMLSNGAINLGDPKPIRAFLHAEDLTDFYEILVAKAGDSALCGQVFNTGPANGETIEELVAKCAEAVGWLGQVNWHTVPKRPGEIYYLNSSPAKAKRLIGWEPKVTLEDGLRRTVDLWRGRI